MTDTPLLMHLRKYMNDRHSMTQKERVILYEEVYDYCFHLANKAFKKVQKKRENLTVDERQRHRVDIFFEYTLDNINKTPEYILFTFNKRFPWIELIVECRLYGIALFGYDVPITKQIGSSKVRVLIKVLRLHRMFIQQYGYEPSVKQLTIELIKHQLRLGKKIKFSCIESDLNIAVKFLYCKRYAHPLTYNID
jgi:hypothetical protein